MINQGSNETCHVFKIDEKEWRISRSFAYTQIHIQAVPHLNPKRKMSIGTPRASPLLTLKNTPTGGFKLSTTIFCLLTTDYCFLFLPTPKLPTIQTY